MTTRLLVVSSVHPPDDPRIRHKLVESLRGVGEVTLAISSPGPTQRQGIAVHELHGHRIRRTAAASWMLLRGNYDVASVHDPELLPAAIVAGLLRRKVVFDLHENLPAQLSRKRQLPSLLRRPLAWLGGRMLRVAEMTGWVTLAEEGYASLFRRPHPVFPNYLNPLHVDVVDPTDRHGVVYLGDITPERGAFVLVEALGHSASRPPLTMIGRCAPETRARIEALAATRGVEVTFTGFLPPDQALSAAARHTVAVSPLTAHPNYQHSLPTKLLEYLALGLPVVASDLPGSRSVVDGLDGVVWVPPSDSVALAEAIDTVISTPSVAVAAVDGAPDIRRRYQWPETAVQRFYSSIAEDAAG